MEVFSARVFEISVVDSSEQKKQTGNVKVEIQYNNAVKAQKAGSAVMAPPASVTAASRTSVPSFAKCTADAVASSPSSTASL